MNGDLGAVLLGKGPEGLGWLHAHQAEMMPRLVRSMIVSVNGAWVETLGVIPELWVDYVVACDRLDHVLPRWAGVVHPIVQWGISEQRGFVPKVPRDKGANRLQSALARWNRDDVCYRDVGVRQAELEGKWARTPEEWRQANELVHDTVSGVTALHFLWTIGVKDVLAVGFDGGAGPGSGGYWDGLVAMHRLARRLQMQVTWHPARPEAELPC